MPFNLRMPGDDRYQPKSLIPYFGYDYLYSYYVEVELALLEALGEIGIIPKGTFRLLTQKVRDRLLTEITTTRVDKYERRVTKHDIRALVHLMQKRMPERLRRFVHIPATSYDIIDTARVAAMARAMQEVFLPALDRCILELTEKAWQYADTVQIGRTHGQHALPITVGFWLATIVNRLIDCRQQVKFRTSELIGKCSGAVGSYRRAGRGRN